MSFPAVAAVVFAVASNVASGAGVPPEFSSPPRHVDLVTPFPGQPATRLEVQTLDGPLILELAAASLRSLDAAAWMVGADGHRTPVPLPPVGTFRGTVEGIPRSVVAAAVVAGGLRAIIDQDVGDPADPLLVIQPAAELGLGQGHVMYATSELKPGDWRCGVDAAHMLEPTGPYGSRACDRVAEIAFDADYEMYQANGASVNATIADVESVMIANDAIYSRDTGISHQVTAFVVRTSPSNPYTATSSGTLLDQFRTEWTNNQTSIRRDLAHLMTGKELDGNVIGLAWVSVVCSGYGYGLSQTLFTTALPYRVGLTAHEVGHNWGAGHCDGDADCSIMCSGIGGCAASVSGFSSGSIAAITAYRDVAACLSSGLPVAFDDLAVTVMGQAVRIDVLGNDSQANCGAATLLSFASSTAAGGSVTRSIGTGPAGRDELSIQPRAGFFGEDRVTYVIRNATGGLATGTARINVLKPRTAETTGLLGGGLDAKYYSTLPASVTDLARGTFVESGSATTINFPSSDANIAGGSRHDGVGMVLTGTLQIPLAGTYTFSCESDDGSVVFVNDALVVTNDGPQGMTEVSGSINLQAGSASVRVEYQQGGGAAGLILRLAGPNLPKQVVPESWWTPPGVTITFLNLGQLLTDLPDFTTTPVYRTGVVGSLNQADFSASSFMGSTRRYNIAGVFSGYVMVPTTGVYSFSTNSDDASTLWIGAARVVSNLGAHGMIERTGTIALAAGAHPLRVEFWQGGGGGGLVASIEGPGLPKQPIPEAMLMRGLPDCDGNGTDDRAEVVSGLDLGDLAVGGNGTGSGTLGAGLVPSSAMRVSPTQNGGSRAAGGSAFAKPDGVNGRPLIPAVSGVFVPSNATTISATGVRYTFSPSMGTATDAIRNGRGLFDGASAPAFSLADQPGVPRRGLSMHTNSGITFDLSRIRTANPGKRILRVNGMAGLQQDGCAGRDAAAEFVVLVDGRQAYRTVLTDDALAQEFSIDLAQAATFLSFAMLEAGSPSCDHFAIADARLLIDTAADQDHDAVLDVCQCIGDFNHDGGVDGADIEAFFLAWQAAEGQADVNRDGGVDGSDLETFFLRWAAGSC